MTYGMCQSHKQFTAGRSCIGCLLFAHCETCNAALKQPIAQCGCDFQLERLLCMLMPGYSAHAFCLVRLVATRGRWWRVSQNAPSLLRPSASQSGPSRVIFKRPGGWQLLRGRKLRPLPISCTSATPADPART